METYINARKKTSARIKSTFWSLYKTMPIEKITIKNITEGSGIHRVTFYIHYTDIYAVLDEIENELLKSLELLNGLEYKTTEDLNDYAKKLFSIYKKDKDYLHLLVIENRHPEFSYKYKLKLKDTFPILFVSTNTSSKASEAVDMMTLVFVDILLRWADKEMFSIDEIIRLTEGIMLKGIYPTMIHYFNLEPATKKEEYAT